LWYDEQRPGLGGDFVAEVTAILERIAANPHSFPLWPGVSATAEPIRRGVLQRFPYVVGFETHVNHILVLAIAHGRRQPLYWLGRAGAAPA
jgi:hypothetical protein